MDKLILLSDETIKISQDTSICRLGDKFALLSNNRTSKFEYTSWGILTDDLITMFTHNEIHVYKRGVLILSIDILKTYTGTILSRLMDMLDSEQINKVKEQITFDVELYANKERIAYNFYKLKIWYCSSYTSKILNRRNETICTGYDGYDFMASWTNSNIVLRKLGIGLINSMKVAGKFNSRLTTEAFEKFGIDDFIVMNQKGEIVHAFSEAEWSKMQAVKESKLMCWDEYIQYLNLNIKD